MLGKQGVILGKCDGNLGKYGGILAKYDVFLLANRTREIQITAIQKYKLYKYQIATYTNTEIQIT